MSRTIVFVIDHEHILPGDYFVRATVSINDVVVGRLSRVLRKQ